MNFKNLFYFINQAFKTIGRNKLMSFSTIFTVAVSLCVVGSFTIFILNTSRFIELQSNKTQLAVYIDSTYKEQQALESGKALKNITGVNDVIYISKNEAMIKQMKRYGGKTQWKEIFGDENPLPYTYNIIVNNPKELEDISLKAKSIKGVYKVDYAKEFVNKITRVVKKIKIVGGTIIGILFLGAIFLVSTTIKLSIYSKRKEIMVMKYVGSTDSFIRGPFIIIGMILGFLGSIIASIILYCIYYYFITKITRSISFLQLYYDPVQIFIIVIGVILSGLFIGIIGSLLSLNKYLKV